MSVKKAGAQQMGITHREVNGQHMKECISMYQKVRLLLQELAHTVIIKAISLSELCQTALQQLHISIIKVVLNPPKNAMKLKKKYGYSVFIIILSSLQLTYQEKTILKKISFLENLTIIKTSTLIIIYLLKLIIISLATHKFMFLLLE